MVYVLVDSFHYAHYMQISKSYGNVIIGFQIRHKSKNLDLSDCFQRIQKK